MPGLVIDLFAGGGGASAGIEAALGRRVDIAINHDAIALAAHKANHPHTLHLEADIWEVRPTDATGGRPVDILWASPDCTHFSVAKGGKPRKQKIRSLAWAVARWAKAVKPLEIYLENVKEFRGWGPLGEDGLPIKARMGETFNRWRRQLERLGYKVDFRLLDSSLYGAPTKRNRLFMMARLDDEAIIWPEITHGAGKLPVHTAAECIDWSLPCPSIFERKRPLAEKTLWRIAQGIRRFVIETSSPFIVKVNHGKDDHRTESIDQPLSTITATRRGHAVVAPHLIKFRHDSQGSAIDQPMPTITAGHGNPDRPAGAGHALGLVAPHLVRYHGGERWKRSQDLTEPLTTLDTSNRFALVSAFIAKHFGDTGQRPGLDCREPLATITASDHHALAAATLLKLRGKCHGARLDLPLPTVTAKGNHLAEVRAFLVTYYGQGVGQSVRKPMRTITTKDRLGLVTVEGIDYQIVDIGMRMLEPEELLRAQFGRFAAGYDLSAAKTKSAKVRLIGNSVCPEVAEAIIRANHRRPLEQAA